MADEDLAAVIVYLRSLPPVRNPLPPTSVIFPVRYLIRGLPEPLTAAVPVPDASTPVKRGAYLADIAACSDCHTPMVRGMPVPGMAYAGGMIIEGPWGRVASANLTPDATGISYYDVIIFVLSMRLGYVNARTLNQVMPCQAYKGMTDDDLADIFAYLRSLPAVAHRVDNAEPPTDCRLCKMKHGLGSSN
jgi:mono/diheme cytochrome c family protein